MIDDPVHGPELRDESYDLHRPRALGQTIASTS
jgi:hypothetical protein